jgi:hypothetical protein
MAILIKYRLVFSLILILCSISYVRIYIRTNQKGILFLIIGSFIGSLGFFLPAYSFSILFLCISYILITLGLILQGTLESGTVKYIKNNTTFYQRLLGDVPIIKDNIKPQFNKKQTILIGIITIGLGFSFAFIKIFFNQENYIFDIICMAIFSGILLIAAAIIWGNRN